MRIALFALFAAGCGTGQLSTFEAGRSTAAAAGHKVTICHATSSAKNPFVQITIDESGLAGHIPHHDGDFLWTAEQGCEVCSPIHEAPTRLATCSDNTGCDTNAGFYCFKSYDAAT